MNVKIFLIKVKTFDGIPTNMEPEKHTDFGWKSVDFVKELDDSTDAVKVLQKYVYRKQ